MSLLTGALTMGCILALMALGVFLTFRIFGFADLATDSVLTLGAATAAVLLTRGVPPVPATLAAVDFTRSIWTGTPAAKNVVVTEAAIRIFRITAKFEALAQRNWKISEFAPSAAGRMPVNPP